MGWRCDFSNFVCDDGLRLLQRKAHTGLPYGQPHTVAIAQEGVIVVGGNELVDGASKSPSDCATKPVNNLTVYVPAVVGAVHRDATEEAPLSVRIPLKTVDRLVLP